MNTSNFFDSYYNNAEVNSILIMNTEGKMLDVNRAFTSNFGYSNEDIKGKNFSSLYKEEDKQKPQEELKAVVEKGQAHDESYILNKQGEPVWCTGEALLVETQEGEQYIVKDIINLQSKKQVQLFLQDTEELLERVFISSQEVPMMILDGSLKIQRVNAAFFRLFEIKETPEPGSRVADLPHPFWNNEAIKNELRQVLVNNKPLRDREFLLDMGGNEKRIKMSTKIVDHKSGLGRRLFLIMEEQ